MKRVLILATLSLATLGAAQTVPSAGMRLWLKGDAGLQTDGHRLETWADQSGLGNDVHAAGGDRPAICGAPDAYQSVYFNGLNSMQGSLGSTALQRASVFALARFALPNPENDYLYAIGNPGSAGSQLGFSRLSGGTPYHFDGFQQHTNAATSIPASSWRVFTQVVGEASPQAHRLTDQSGLLLLSGAINAYNVAPEIAVGSWSGGTAAFRGDLAELLVYDRVLSVAEELAVTAYLTQRIAALSTPPLNLEPALSMPRDLSTWTVEQFDAGCLPDANWMVNPLDPSHVLQPTHADASILLSDVDCADADIRVDVLPGAGSNYAGIVFGYQDRGHFYLLDWRRATIHSSCAGGTAITGATLRVVDAVPGSEPAAAELWTSPMSSASTTVLRESSVPWELDTWYTLRLVFRAGEFRVQLRTAGGTTACDTILDWTVQDSTFTSGRYGLYLQEQREAEFRNVTVDAIETTPGCGAPGTGPRLRSVTPFVGSNWSMQLDQVTASTNGTLFISTMPTTPIDLGMGCTLAIDPASFGTLLPIAVGASGSWQSTLPLPPGLPVSGIQVAMQAFVGASAGPLGGDLSNGVVLRLQ